MDSRPRARASRAGTLAPGARSAATSRLHRFGSAFGPGRPQLERRGTDICAQGYSVNPMVAEQHKEVLVARLDEVTRELDVTVARLDELTGELDQITSALGSLDEELRSSDELLAATLS